MKIIGLMPYLLKQDSGQEILIFIDLTNKKVYNIDSQSLPQDESERIIKQLDWQQPVVPNIVELMAKVNKSETAKGKIPDVGSK